MTVRPAKTQISLGIRPVWSESSLSAWRKLGTLATHWAHSGDSDQTGRMPRLIWVFPGRTVILLVLSWGGSILFWESFLKLKWYKVRWNCNDHELIQSNSTSNGKRNRTLLTHISLASHFRDIGKQCRPRLHAAARSVWSGSTLFAHKDFYKNMIKMKKVHQAPLKWKLDSSSL